MTLKMRSFSESEGIAARVNVLRSEDPGGFMARRSCISYARLSPVWACYKIYVDTMLFGCSLSWFDHYYVGACNILLIT